jgi:hypothetical protein
MKLATLIRLALSVMAIASIFLLVSIRSFYDVHIASIIFGTGLLSLYFILLRTRISIREQLGAFFFTAALVIFDVRFLGYQFTWPAAMTLLGFASLAILFFRFIWAPPSERRMASYVLLPALFIFFSDWCAGHLLHWTEIAQPSVLDLYLYSFEASTRVQLPFLVGQMFQRSHALGYVCIEVYLGLLILISLTYIGCLLRNVRTALSALTAFLLTAPVGILFYNFFPALGPRFIFGSGFPWHPLVAEQARRLVLQPIAMAGARNAMPSLHATCVFLVFWYARGLSRVERAVAAICVLLTLLATVGTGEHYAIDLVVAVPFTAMIIALTNLLVGNDRARQYVPLGIGLGVVTAWLLALRYATNFFWQSLVIPWLAILATLAISYLALKKTENPACGPLTSALRGDPLSTSLPVSSSSVPT